MRDERVFLGWAKPGERGPLTIVTRQNQRDRRWLKPRIPRAGQKLDVACVWPWGTVPHALVVGSTGGGKTSLLRVAATSLIRTAARPDVRHELSLILVDGKGGDSFMMFDPLAGVATANGPTEMVEAIAGVHAQMEARYATLAQARQRAAATRQPANWCPPPYLHLWVDEYLSGLMRVPDRDRTATVGRLIDIGLRGRESRVRLLLAMQRPDAKTIDAGLPGLLKSLLKARMAAFGTMGMDSLEARMAFDDSTVSERIHPRDRGALLRVGRHEVEFKVARLADPTDPTVSEADRRAAWEELPPPVQVEVN
jgi:DNA segregation ATPase FtsK/SpoIIIE-like protein